MNFGILLLILPVSFISSQSPPCPFSKSGFSCNCSIQNSRIKTVFKDVQCEVGAIFDDLPKFDNSPGQYSISNQLNIRFSIPNPPSNFSIKIDADSFIDFTTIGSLVLSSAKSDVSLLWDEKALQGTHLQHFSTSIPSDFNSTLKALKQVANGLESFQIKQSSHFQLASEIFKDFKKLRSLSIETSRLFGNPDPDAFAGLEDTLIDLNFSRDQITLIYPAFKKLKQLKTLDLSKNLALTMVDLSDFDGLDNLELLNLTANAFELKMDSLEKVPSSLHRILASYSALSIDISLTGLLNRAQFQLLDISNSNLICDQTMQWMAKFAMCNPVRLVISGALCNGLQSVEDYLMENVPNPCN